MAFDFRFYGHAPADWYEGANDGHLFEILFRREPTPDDKARLAEVFERALSSGPARSSDAPWTWAGGFCRFCVGERWSSAPRLAFARVTDFLMDARRVVPIEQVVFHGAREAGNSNWARWTSSVQPVPTPGPPGLDPQMCHIDANLAAPVTDAAFEQARAATRATLRQQRAREAGERSGTGLTLTPREAAPTGATQPPELTAKFRIPDSPTYQKTYGNQVHTYVSDGDHLSHWTPRLIAGVHRDGDKIGIAYLDDAGERREVALTGGHLVGPALSPDASRGIVACGVELYEVDFETGDATPRWRAEATINGVAVLDERWAVKTRDELIVLEPGPQRPEIAASLRLKGQWITAILGGTVIATSTYPRSIDFAGFCEGKLKKLASLKTYLGAPKEIDGEIVYRGVDGDAYVLDGLDELYQAWAGPLRDKAETARKKARARKAKSATARPARAAKPALVPVALSDVPATDPLGMPPSEEDRARFAQDAQVHRAPGGRLAALLPRVGPGASVHFLQFASAAWLDAAGALHQQALGQPTPDRATLSADGGLLAISTVSGTFHFLDLDSEARATFDASHAELGFAPRRAIVPHRDLIVLVYAKGIAWWQRGAAGWHEVGRAKIAGFTAVVVNPARALACCLSSAKARLVVYRARDGALAKVAAFTERIREVRSRGDQVYALTVEGDAFELTGA